MIRNPDFDTFVCCAVCSKLIPPPPTPETFDRIREYKPYKTRYYTHKDILELGADLKQEAAERKELETEKRIEKLRNRLLLQAETEKEDAVEDALIRAEALHKKDLEDLKTKDEQALLEAVKNTRVEMLQHLELELKRESEAAEQRMTHKLHRLIKQFHLEKAEAIAEARQEERQKIAGILATQKKKHLEQMEQAGAVAHAVYQRNLQLLALEKKHEMEIAFSISQKEYKEETEKLLKSADTLREAQLEEVTNVVNRKDSEILSLGQQLEHMTSWKDSLEAEILETREAFQKYINLTFPQLAPGQADFILPFRKISPFLDSDAVEHTQVTAPNSKDL
ncbi:uncharacterized protein C6orf163 homolog [Sceloporus undulatus]|uniref:uncharacterized protein C6orf163 homolog n=1 Tax=Sceloporus undulatus TaxID=8520 RepID=UPI001C4AC028|nr:uncharacterized protein C6orf163 homolog [Sceloporus undulatus]XP_042299408.1 uncharacterized protein C6orf163 homolog [Sceloporus undulatus]